MTDGPLDAPALQARLDDFVLSTRARSFVRRRRLRTLGDLVRFDPAALAQEPNLGPVTAREIATLVESRCGATWGEARAALRGPHELAAARAAPLKRAVSKTRSAGAGRGWGDLAASVPASHRNTPLANVPGVPARIRRVAARWRLGTLGALLDLPEEKLLDTRNLGPDTLAQCRDAVAAFVFGGASWGRDVFALDDYPDVLALWRERLAALDKQPRTVLALSAGLAGPALPHRRIAARIRRSTADVASIEVTAIRTLMRDRAWLDAIGDRLLAHVAMGPRRLADIAADDPWFEPILRERAVASVLLDHLLAPSVRRETVDGEERIVAAAGAL